MGSPTAAHNLPVQHWYFRHKTFVQWSRMEENIYLFSFYKFYKFLLLSLPILARAYFFKKNPKFCIKFLHNLHGQKSHFQLFSFDLNSSRDLEFLYLDWRFAQRKGARYVTVSIPYFTVFLFSVKISWKFLILWMLAWKLKSEFIIGGIIPFTIL